MEKSVRVRKDGQPYGSPNPNARVRMSKAAELKIHNGVSLKEENPDDVIISDTNNDGPASDPVSDEQKQEMQPKPEEGKLIVMEEPKIVERKVRILVGLNQEGIKDKDGNLVDPNNNTFKTIEVEMTGDLIDIAKVSGRIANSLHDFYASLSGIKGIKRGSGFNVNLRMEEELNGEAGTMKVRSISKVRMSNPVDVAFKIGNALLTEFEAENADGLMTGNFRVGKEGALLLKKLNFDEKTLNLPLHVVKQQLNEKRLTINKNVKENKQFIK